MLPDDDLDEVDFSTLVEVRSVFLEDELPLVAFGADFLLCPEVARAERAVRVERVVCLERLVIRRVLGVLRSA